MKMEERKASGLWKDAWKRFKKLPGAVTGVVFIAFLFITAYFAPLIANNKPVYVRLDEKIYFPALRDLFPFNIILPMNEIDKIINFNPDFFIETPAADIPRISGLIMPPCPYSPLQTRLDDIRMAPNFASRHIFGCDDNGRDIFARIIYGSRVSLLVGFVAQGIAILIGVLLGAIAGYYGGIIDTIIISRIIEVMMCFPTFFLILTIVAVIDTKYLNIWTIMIVIGITSWTSLARYARAEFIRLLSVDFVSSARAIGARPFRIILQHILPNALAPIFISASFGIAGAILAEASLSFLGLGVQPPNPSWGNILNMAQKHWGDWWLGVFPGAAIFFSVLSYNLVGEGLRDAIDPRLR